MTRLKLIGLIALSALSAGITLVGIALLIQTDPLPQASSDAQAPTKIISEPVCPAKHSSLAFGYEFCYPKTWFLAEFGLDRESLAVDPNGVPSDATNALIAVSAMEIFSADALADFRQRLVQAREERFTLDDMDGTKISGRLDGEEQQIIVATRGRYTYIITMRAALRTFERHQPSFQSLLATWRWVEIAVHAPVRSALGDLIVELPPYGSIIRSQATLRGKIRSPISRFGWRLKDAAGKNVAQGSGMAADDKAGQLNPFSALLKFSALSSDSGMLEVYTESIEDGSEENLVIIPVKFQ